MLERIFSIFFQSPPSVRLQSMSHCWTRKSFQGRMDRLKYKSHTVCGRIQSDSTIFTYCSLCRTAQCGVCTPLTPSYRIRHLTAIRIDRRPKSTSRTSQSQTIRTINTCWARVVLNGDDMSARRGVRLAYCSRTRNARQV